MPRACTICSNKNRSKIESALAQNSSYRLIASQFRVNYKAVERHAKEHIKKDLEQAKGCEVIKRAVSLAEQIEESSATSRGGEPQHAKSWRYVALASHSVSEKCSAGVGVSTNNEAVSEYRLKAAVCDVKSLVISNLDAAKRIQAKRIVAPGHWRNNLRHDAVPLPPAVQPEPVCLGTLCPAAPEHH